MNVEQRRFKRYLANDEAFAGLRPGFEKLGKIRDISKGGLAFIYVSAEPDSKKGRMEIDIFVSDKKYYLPRLPCKIIYDIRDNDNSIFLATVHSRKCAVQFGELNNEQRKKLDFFLKNYVSGTA